MARKPKAAPLSAAEALAAIRASGAAPLDFMLQVMRDESLEPAKRLDAAKAAAPYVHPRLASVAVGMYQAQPAIFAVTRAGTRTQAQVSLGLSLAEIILGAFLHPGA